MAAYYSVALLLAVVLAGLLTQFNFKSVTSLTSGTKALIKKHPCQVRMKPTGSPVYDLPMPIAYSFETRRVRVGVDYGPRTIGVARSDIIGLIEPYGAIPNTSNLTDISLRILGMARSWGAREVVVGVPLDSDGKLDYSVRNVNGQICLNFSRVLATVAQYDREAYGGGTGRAAIQVLLLDERYTTQEAKVRMRMGRIKGATRIT